MLRTFIAFHWEVLSVDVAPQGRTESDRVRPRPETQRSAPRRKVQLRDERFSARLGRVTRPFLSGARMRARCARTRLVRIPCWVTPQSHASIFSPILYLSGSHTRAGDLHSAALDLDLPLRAAPWILTHPCEQH